MGGIVARQTALKPIGLLLLVALWLVGDVARSPFIAITWQTPSEFNVAGYVVERAADPAGPFTRVSPLVAPGVDPFVYHEYLWRDTAVAVGQIYHYQLTTITNTNERLDIGRLSAVAR